MSDRQRVKVLMAEDDFFVAEEIAHAIDELGYDLVARASNGAKAVELTCSHKPDLVFMDIKMPKIDGIEACRRIQQRCPTPVVILTAYESKELLEKATEAGVSTYLTKPPKASEMARATTIAIERHNDLRKQHRLTEELQTANRRLQLEIKEREKAEKALIANRADLESAQRLAHLGSWSYDAKSKRFSWSDEMFRVFGCDEGTEEPSEREFRSMFHPDDRDRFGKSFHDALMEGKNFENKFRIVVSGGMVRHIVCRGQAQLGNRGSIVRVFGTCQDISQRIMMEDELFRMKKMESFGVLAGGIAHDFNNLLTAILGGLSLVESQIPAGNLMKKVRSIKRAALKAKKLTRQFNILSGNHGLTKKTCTVPSLFKNAKRTVQKNPEIESSFTFSNDLWLVAANETLMNQAILNLLTNAVESMPDGGRIRASARNTVVEENHDANLKAGNYVKVMIEDAGGGIGPETLDRIFDPYFSTKTRGTKKGMGLGLSVCHSIVEQHGGGIAVESRLEKGTVFEFYLPAAGQPAVETRIERPVEEGEPLRENLRVLVMDDEEMIREVIDEMLDLLGHRCTLCKTGEEAVELYRDSLQAGSPFDIVILDLTVVVGMGGKEAMQLLKTIDPNVCGIVSSGYSKDEDPVVAHPESFCFRESLPKPYGLDELRKILDGVALPLR
ncbi:MAG: response regulator [Proteobacteria bacterium]|nr:response regulator [Pseudomonadota bacterium]